MFISFDFSSPWSSSSSLYIHTNTHILQNFSLFFSLCDRIKPISNDLILLDYRWTLVVDCSMKGNRGQWWRFPVPNRCSHVTNDEQASEKKTDSIWWIINAYLEWERESEERERLDALEIPIPVYMRRIGDREEKKAEGYARIARVLIWFLLT